MTCSKEKRNLRDFGVLQQEIDFARQETFQSLHNVSTMIESTMTESGMIDGRIWKNAKKCLQVSPQLYALEMWVCWSVECVVFLLTSVRYSIFLLSTKACQSCSSSWRQVVLVECAGTDPLEWREIRSPSPHQHVCGSVPDKCTVYRHSWWTHSVQTVMRNIQTVIRNTHPRTKGWKLLIEYANVTMDYCYASSMQVQYQWIKIHSCHFVSVVERFCTAVFSYVECKLCCTWNWF